MLTHNELIIRQIPPAAFQDKLNSMEKDHVLCPHHVTFENYKP